MQSISVSIFRFDLVTAVARPAGSKLDHSCSTIAICDHAKGKSAYALIGIKTPSWFRSYFETRQHWRNAAAKRLHARRCLRDKVLWQNEHGGWPVCWTEGTGPALSGRAILDKSKWPCRSKLKPLPMKTTPKNCKDFTSIAERSRWSITSTSGMGPIIITSKSEAVTATSIFCVIVKFEVNGS